MLKQWAACLAHCKACQAVWVPDLSRLSKPEGTGADRQIAIYKETGDLQKVVELLIEQTMKGIELDNTHSPERFLKFKQYQPVG